MGQPNWKVAQGRKIQKVNLEGKKDYPSHRRNVRSVFLYYTVTAVREVEDKVPTLTQIDIF